MSLPDAESSDFTPILLYRARAHIALNDPKSALKLLPADSENVAIKAVAALARYVDTEETEDKESALEELRDLSVEIEGDDVEGTERDKSIVRVLAGTAFARAGEVEEALETLGVGTEDLEAYVASKPPYTYHSPDPVSPLLCRSTYPSTVLISPRKSSNARNVGLKMTCCCSSSNQQ